MFTAKALREQAAEASGGVVYELRDELGICILFFRYDDVLFLLGPYVRQVFDEGKTRRVLPSMHMPASYLSSLRLTGSGFPLLSSTQVRNTAVACLNALTGEDRDYSSCRVEWDAVPPRSGTEGGGAEPPSSRSMRSPSGGCSR